MRKFILLFIPLFFILKVHSQNVGIGTSTPVAKLDINGTLKLTDGTQGIGKILTSDSTGMASWQDPPVTEIDYPTATMGCSAWMNRNLDVATYRNGDPIPKVTDNAAWDALTTGAYCYYNNDSTTYAATYGKLYNWYAVNDPRGLAPEGWHVPSEYEWTEFSDGLGGEGVAGGHMKETGTTHWNPPNYATNYAFFIGLPDGYRNVDGGYYSIGNDGYFWSANEENINNANYRLLFYNNDDLYRSNLDKNFGFSVRCVRD